MTNEFGIRLDRNGYAPSIMEPVNAPCAICGRRFGAKMDRHEPWSGSNRAKSKALGLWITLCHDGCHEGPGSVHDDAALAREWRCKVQEQAMGVFGWSREEWIRRFGKSLVGEESGETPQSLRDSFPFRGAKNGVNTNSSSSGEARNEVGGGFGAFRVLASPDLPY